MQSAAGLRWTAVISVILNTVLTDSVIGYSLVEDSTHVLLIMNFFTL